MPVSIGGITFKPSIPIESVVKETIESILQSKNDDIDIAIELCIYIMKTQVFIDGNKRTAIIYANHYLISHVHENHVSEFKRKLVEYYEGEDISVLSLFLKQYCWRNF